MKMTNLKKFASLLTFTAVVALAAMPALAGNLEDAQVRSLESNKLSKIVYGAVAGSKMVNLKHTPVAGSTGAYVTITSLAMTFYSPFGTVDTTIGTSGVVTFASTLGSDTMGGLCDYINNIALYDCTLTGAKRDDVTTFLTAQTATNGTNDLEAAGGFDVTNSTAIYIRLGINPQSATKRVVLKQCQGYSAVAENVYVYGALSNTNGKTDQWGAAVNDSTKVFQYPLAQTTLTAVPSAYVIPDWLKFAPGAHVVASIGYAASTKALETSSNWLLCSWSEE